MFGLSHADAIAARILTMTDEVWCQPPSGPRAEPIDAAWRRMFGEPLNGKVPILFLPTEWQGRTLACVLYDRGRVTVDDPFRGRSIRVIKPEHAQARTEIGNLAGEMSALHPTAAWIQRERPDGYASMTDGRSQALIRVWDASDAIRKESEHDPLSELKREAEAFFGEAIEVFAVVATTEAEQGASHLETHQAKVGGSTQEFLKEAAHAA